MIRNGNDVFLNLDLRNALFRIDVAFAVTSLTDC
jgi:hypothetical protein